MIHLPTITTTRQPRRRRSRPLLTISTLLVLSCVAGLALSKILS